MQATLDVHCNMIIKAKTFFYIHASLKMVSQNMGHFSYSGVTHQVSHQFQSASLHKVFLAQIYTHALMSVYQPTYLELQYPGEPLRISKAGFTG